jgi:hypothetical protein
VRHPATSPDPGLPVTQGLLGVEWDKGLLPQSFHALVNHGDRVAIVDGWILDTGHDDYGGFHRKLWLLRIPYMLRRLMFGSSLDTLRVDDFRPSPAGRVGPKLSSVARRTAA